MPKSLWSQAPVTDNGVGCQYIRQVMGIPAINARKDPGEMGKLIAKPVT